MYHFSRWNLAIELNVGLLTLEGLVCVPIYIACYTVIMYDIARYNKTIARYKVHRLQVQSRGLVTNVERGVLLQASLLFLAQKMA